jgi:hypothetical protein
VRSTSGYFSTANHTGRGILAGSGQPDRERQSIRDVERLYQASLFAPRQSTDIMFRATALQEGYSHA